PLAARKISSTNIVPAYPPISISGGSFAHLIVALRLFELRDGFRRQVRAIDRPGDLIDLAGKGEGRLVVGANLSRAPQPRYCPRANNLRAGKARTANVRFGSKADICSAKRHVRFGPKADISNRSAPAGLLAFTLDLTSRTSPKQSAMVSGTIEDFAYPYVKQLTEGQFEAVV